MFNYRSTTSRFTKRSPIQVLTHTLLFNFNSLHSTGFPVAVIDKKEKDTQLQLVFLSLERHQRCYKLCCTQMALWQKYWLISDTFLCYGFCCQQMVLLRDFFFHCTDFSRAVSATYRWPCSGWILFCR